MGALKELIEGCFAESPGDRFIWESVRWMWVGIMTEASEHTPKTKKSHPFGDLILLFSLSVSAPTNTFHISASTPLKTS